jgi:hypothetical protein
MKALEADVRSGLPSDALATRHAMPVGFVSNEAKFARWMDELRREGLGPYRDLSVPAPAASLSVERLAKTRQSNEPVRIVRLSGGETFEQRFEVIGPAELRRIDVELKKRRWGRWPDQFDWSLRRITGGSPGSAVAGGQVDLDRLKRYEYATLNLDGIRVTGPAEYELVFHAPGDATEGCYAEIPLFEPADTITATDPTVIDDSGEQLKGFLYLIRECSIAQSPGQSPTELR